MHATTRHLISIAIALLAASGAAQATDFGHHPAVRTAPAAQGVDANTFIVQPPATTHWAHAHANAEHPAVTAARIGVPAKIDANAFIVQPPASVTWTQGPAQNAQPVAIIAAAGAR